MKLVRTVMSFAVVLALCFPALRAQNQQDAKPNTGPVRPDSPLPPIDTNPEARTGQGPAAASGVSPAYDSQPYEPAQVEPDTHTLSGAELFSVGSLGKSRTVFDPSLLFSETGTSGADPRTKILSTTLLGGSLNVAHTWGISHLVASYNGLETIFIPHDLQYVYYHDLSIEDVITWARWRLRMRDDLTVSPYGNFGGQGIGGPGMLGQFNAPSQTVISGSSGTIQTVSAIRTFDAALGEVDYAFSRNSTVSISGSYGLMHFLAPGFIDSHSLNGQGGFDYMLGPKNSIAVIGGYGKTDFGVSTDSSNEYFGEIAYGRKVTGKVGLQVAVGPEQVQSRSAGSADIRFLTWSANAAISYQLRRTSYSLYYAHGFTNGSGVLTGALGHTFSASVSHSLTRYWSAGVNGGYALNRSLAVPAAPTSFSFTNWYSGTFIGRRVDHHVDISFNYGVQHQGSTDTCPVLVCGWLNGYLYTFGTTVNWHLRRVE